MRKILIIAGIVLGILIIIAVGTLIFFSFSGPKKKDYAHLADPRIVTMPDTPALIVQFEGDPNEVIKNAFDSLFKVYFSLKDVPKGPNQPAPVARYEGFEEILSVVDEDDLKSVDWKGYVAIPVPSAVTLPAEQSGSRAYKTELGILKYGTVAEIVHFGTYASETENIKKLQNYIKDQGYAIAGLHEEEYIKGPGMPFVRPEDYITMIRYRVKKIAE